MASLKGVLLDVDGTLINSNDAHARAWQQAFNEIGVEVSFKQIRDKIGMGGDHIIPLVLGLREDHVLAKQIEKRRAQIFNDVYLPELRPFPFAQQLVEKLQESGLKTVAASSASQGDLEKLLGKAGVKRSIQEQTSSDSAERSKPAPDIIKAALEKGSLRASSAILIGDTPYDIAAAHAAHVPVIAFTCGGWSEEELAAAEVVLSGPEELFELLKNFEGPSVSEEILRIMA